MVVVVVGGSHRNFCLVLLQLEKDRTPSRFISSRIERSESLSLSCPSCQEMTCGFAACLARSFTTTAPTMTTPHPPPRLLRRRELHSVHESDSTKARLSLALACLWPLVIFFFASSSSHSSNPSDHEDVHPPQAPAAGLESIRNLLDRVDILGYGPTHPRVAVVVVGDDRSKILSSVESVFRYESIILLRVHTQGS